MFVIDVPYMNLDHIYNSGQAPRWIKLKEGKYIVQHKDKAVKIEQQRDKFDFAKYRFVMNCSEEDFYNVWFHYFDLQTDYFEKNNKIKSLGRKFKVLANKAHGIHILGQDMFEVYVLSKIIANAGYEKSKVAMNHIAEVCGIKHVQSMGEAGKITWYEFPTPEMVLKKHDKLKRMGKINNWLKRLCEAIVNEGYLLGNIDNWNDICKVYMGAKNTFAFSGIEDTILKEFGESPDEFVDWYLNEVDDKGILYMYIVHEALKSQRRKI